MYKRRKGKKQRIPHAGMRTLQIELDGVEALDERLKEMRCFCRLWLGDAAVLLSEHLCAFLPEERRAAGDVMWSRDRGCQMWSNRHAPLVLRLVEVWFSPAKRSINPACHMTTQEEVVVVIKMQEHHWKIGAGLWKIKVVVLNAQLVSV